jgi:hypothetical protein
MAGKAAPSSSAPLRVDGCCGNRHELNTALFGFVHPSCNGVDGFVKCGANADGNALCAGGLFKFI